MTHYYMFEILRYVKSFLFTIINFINLFIEFNSLFIYKFFFFFFENDYFFFYKKRGEEIMIMLIWCMNYRVQTSSKS